MPIYTCTFSVRQSRLTAIGNCSQVEEISLEIQWGADGRSGITTKNLQSLCIRNCWILLELLPEDCTSLGSVWESTFLENRPLCKFLFQTLCHKRSPLCGSSCLPTHMSALLDYDVSHLLFRSTERSVGGQILWNFWKVFWISRKWFE